LNPLLISVLVGAGFAMRVSFLKRIWATLRRQIYFLGMFSAVLLVGALLGFLRGSAGSEERRDFEISRSTATGEWLRLSQLAAGESIVITHLSPGDRDSRAWTYQLEGGDPLQLLVMEHEPAWEKDRGLVAGKILSSAGRTLTKGEVTALEIFWQAIQVPAPTHRKYQDTYQVEYLRGGRTIGRETFIDDAPGTMEQRWWSYEELPPSRAAALTREQWLAARSFRALVVRNEESSH
jgi:hypothetical protein